MGVKVKKIRGSWYLVINFKGHRKTKKIGSSLEIAREVARKVEGRLALGDMGVFGEDETKSVLFSDYADRWLKKHIEINTKPATFALYKWLMDCHILPYFGKQRVSAVTAERVEDFVYALATKKEDGQCVHAQKTISLIVGCLRSFYTYAVKHKAATSNPASCLGRMVKSDKPAREIESMTQRESELFLEAVRDLFPERYPLFLTALRTGMRRGELIGLKWGDCAFGKDENDPNRYFMVSRQFTVYGFETPKTAGSKRRVDMSKQLRSALLELREARMLAAMQLGTDESFSEQLLFPREDGEPLTPRTIGLRFMDPACQAAGIQRFTPHALRHTFAVLLIQSGASLKYVSEQLGHSSIKITADVYGRLQPSANVSLIDRLDSPAQTDANHAQTLEISGYEVGVESVDVQQLRGKLSESMNLIAYQTDRTETIEFKGGDSAERGNLRQETQTRCKREGGSEQNGD